MPEQERISGHVMLDFRLTPEEAEYLRAAYEAGTQYDPSVVIGGPRETIACAAIRCPHGRVFSLPQPARHHNVIWHMVDEYGYRGHEVGPDYQGFVTSAGRYVDREEAWRIAKAAGQIKRVTGSEGALFSEDMW